MSGWYDVTRRYRWKVRVSVKMIVAEMLGITVADIRSIERSPDRAQLVVRTWNRRRLSVSERDVFEVWMRTSSPYRVEVRR